MKAANAKGSGSVTTKQPTVLVHPAQGCLLRPSLLEDKSPFLHLAQPKASPGRTPSPTDAEALLMQCRLHSNRLHRDLLPYRAPGEPLHPTAHRLQSACLPQAHVGRGALGGPLLPDLLLPTETQARHGTAHPDSPHIRYQQTPELHCVPLARTRAFSPCS